MTTAARYGLSTIPAVTAIAPNVRTCRGKGGLQKRKDEILPVNYFHVVFTLPHELNTIILNNKKVMFNILFAAASKTLLSFGENQLNGTPGFLAILHTWDQKLNAHFHLHCIIAGGAVSKDDKKWIAGKDDYLFNQDALSRVFRSQVHPTHERCH